MASSRIRQFIDDALASDAGDCIEWPFAVRKSSGYPAYTYRSSGRKISVDAHRYVCALAHGKPIDDEQAAHSCGTKICINPRHLRWATPQENMDDAKSHGTLKGGGRYRQRIFEPEIEDICTSGDSLLALAEKYSSDVAYIGRVKRTHIHRFTAHG
jgi:hypothetical protein